jgi:hypothetical protein
VPVKTLPEEPARQKHMTSIPYTGMVPDLMDAHPKIRAILGATWEYSAQACEYFAIDAASIFVRHLLLLEKLIFDEKNKYNIYKTFIFMETRAHLPEKWVSIWGETRVSFS